MLKDLTLRSTFNEVAQLYDKIRPDYPEELFYELINQTKLNKDSKLIEIGAGTGQATISFAKHGYNIIANELGKQLAEILEKNLKNYPTSQVITGAFEDIQLSNESFDMIYAATAFHWLKSEVKFLKPYQLLKQGGYLAIINGAQISDEIGDKFFHASQPIYNKYWQSDPDNPFTLKKLNEIKPAELDTKLFNLIYFNCFPRTILYTGDEYCELLNTDSEKLALTPDKRACFLDEIKQLINNYFSKGVSTHYANSLTIAKKIP